MATFPCPVRREILESNRVDDERSTLEDTIANHHFNHAVDVMLPNSSGCFFFNTAINKADWEYYMVHQVSLDRLLDQDFIGAFVKNGCICALSTNTRIDVDNCVSLHHPGILVLSLLKDDYEELGLQGRPSQFTRKEPTKYLVTLDLTASYFYPGKKLYDRAARVFRERKHLSFDILFSWEPHEEDISSRSLYKYLQTWGCKVDICTSEKQVAAESDIGVPNVNTSNWEDGEEQFGFPYLLEWIGTICCNVDCSATNDDRAAFVSSYKLPALSSNIGSISKCHLTGFLSAQRILKFINHLRTLVTPSEFAWAAIVVHGFDDAPVSWGTQEHGFLSYGDNLYAVVLFSDSRYWLCKGGGPRDVLPHSAKPHQRSLKSTSTDQDGTPEVHL